MRSPLTLRTPLVVLALGALACTTTIEPGDTRPEISVENVVCPEGTGATSTCNVPVRLASAGTAPVVFKLTHDASASTATEGADFTFASAELTIPAGETTHDVELTIIGDALFEPDEVVALKLEIVSGARPASINGAGALVSIANDDAAPPTITIRMENRLCAEGNTGTSICGVAVRLSEPAPTDVSFNVGLDSSATTATLTTDFLFAASSFTIAAGEDVVDVPLTIVGDFDFEPDEIVALTIESLSGAVPATINGTGALISITNDDSDAVPTSPASIGATRFQHTATKLADGRIFVAGGHNGATEVDTTFIISADGMTVTAGPTLPEARARHCATRLADGRVLLSGGLTVGSPLALVSTVLCDLTANTCVHGPAMSSGRMLHVSIELHDHRVLIAGGVPNYGTSAKLSSAELFVAANGTDPDLFVAAENDLPDATDSNATALFPNGDVLIAGGAGAGTNIQLVRYHPGTGFTRDASSLTYGHVNATATALADGRIMIAGGLTETTTEFVLMGSNPADPLFVSSGPTMSESRYYHVAVPLNDGRVMLTGGYAWDTATSTLSARSTVEIFSAPLNGFTTSTSLSVARADFGAVALDNGYVVHIGGSNGSAPTSTMDVLRP